MSFRVSKSSDLFSWALIGCLLCLGTAGAFAESLPAAGTVPTVGTLHYSINWPSGLSLGEATIQSNEGAFISGLHSYALWDFSLMLDAAIPGFTLRDEYRSQSDDKFCSTQLEKTVTRGARKSSEKVTIDQANKTVHRDTPGGGMSDYTMPECAHDALSFFQFVRQELAQGRLAPSQAVVFGAKYDIQLTYAGGESIKRGDKMVDADRVHVVAKGPKADINADIYFARDPARTPLVAKIPLALGTFSVELQ
jgi:hypothetical protein